jgi:peptide/nickel transport system substrate-binding protein
VTSLIHQEETATDPARRTALIGQVQEKVAAALPLLPLLQGSTAIVTRADVAGVPAKLDSSYQFRWAELSRTGSR